METERKEFTGRNGNRNPAEETRGGASRPVGDLFKELLHESEALVRGEVQLLRTELSEKITSAQHGITSMLTGAAVLFGGILVLLAAAVLGLGQIIPLWASALIIGSAMAIIGGVMVAGGKKKIEPHNLKPNRALEEAKAEGRFLKEKVS